MEAVIERLSEVDAAILEDLNHLLGQLKSNFSTPETLENLQTIISDPNVVTIVAREGDRIVGMGYLFILKTLLKPKAIIEDIVVDAGQQGKGLGVSIMQALIQAARDAEVAYIDLTSKPSRIAANKLYQKVGFEQRETNAYRLTL